LAESFLFAGYLREKIRINSGSQISRGLPRMVLNKVLRLRVLQPP
jgi:hypothetical protein